MICVHVCVFAQLCTIHMRIYIYAHMCLCVCVRVCVYMCLSLTCVHICMRVCVENKMFVCVYIVLVYYIYICVCVVFTPCTQPSSQLLQAVGWREDQRQERAPPLHATSAFRLHRCKTSIAVDAEKKCMQHLLSDFVDA